jgi:hypothetical protein
MIGLGYFANQSEEEVKSHIVSNYYVEAALVNKYDILCAYEDDDGGYGEYSFFLLRDKETGKLFENHAAHCSCQGFEEQFDPKESSLVYLRSDHFHADGVSQDIIREVVKDL